MDGRGKIRYNERCNEFEPDKGKSPIMNCRAVIFDLDGVLVDSYQMHYECWRSIAEEYSLRVTQKEFDSLFGRRGRDIVRRIWGSDLSDEQVTSIHKRKQAIMFWIKKKRKAIKLTNLTNQK